MLVAALRRLDDSSNADDRVYATESRPGVRKYTVMTPAAAWQKTSCSKQPTHLYEVLSGPCNLYLDIEWLSEDPLSADSERARVQPVIDAVCEALRARYHEISPTVTMVSASGHTSKGYKCSWHVHVACATVAWLNAVAVGQFVRHVCSDMVIVDKVPYAGTGQNWRCVGSAKAAEPARAFLPATESIFHQCTVQQAVNGRTLIYPEVSPLSSVSLPVPSYIRRLAATLDATTEPAMCSATRCMVPFRVKQYCEFAGRYHRSNHQYAVIDTEALQWKQRCHACPDAIGFWRPFSDMEAVHAAFVEQMQGYTANAPVPATKTDARADHFDLQTLGPPPRRSGGGVTQCRDGCYG